MRASDSGGRKTTKAPGRNRAGDGAPTGDLAKLDRPPVGAGHARER
jgi:hypothetical protein